MAQSTVFCVALLAAFSVLVAAQQQQQQACQDIVGMKNINATNFTGHWYEIARAPAINSAGCIQTNIVLANNNTQLNVTTMYSPSNTSLHIDKYVRATINITDVNDNNGFNLTFTGATSSNVTYKIIDSDNKSYVIVCGYTSSNVSSSFGAVLVRNANVNYTWLDDIVANTSKVLLNFNNNTVANITQLGCLASSASTSMPYLASMFALFFLVAKMIK